jgi:hypothetical protein
MTCTGCIYTRELLKEHDDNTDHGLPKDATSEHVLPRCHLELELGPGPGLVETRMRQDGVGSDDNPLGLDSGIRRRQLSQAAKTVQAVTVAAPHCQPPRGVGEEIEQDDKDWTCVSGTRQPPKWLLGCHIYGAICTLNGRRNAQSLASNLDP